MVIISRPTDRPTNIKRSFVVDKKSAACCFYLFFLPLVFAPQNFLAQKEAKKARESFAASFRIRANSRFVVPLGEERASVERVNDVNTRTNAR